MKKPKTIKDVQELIERSDLNPAQLKALIAHIKTPVNTYSQKRRRIEISGKRVKFGVVGDTHLNSKFSDLNFLRELYKHFDRLGCEFVIQTGDLTEGDYQERAGHVYEVLNHGFDKIVDYVVKEYPRLKNGGKTYFILGNHDETHMKYAGADILKAIADRRSDMVYLGRDSMFPREGEIRINKKTLVRILHPGKGTPYAISYHMQKWAESIEGGDKPHIAIFGHYHKAEYLFYRNIHIFQAGTTQNQTPWMATQNISAHKTGLVLEVQSKKDGTIERIIQEWLPCYD